MDILNNPAFYFFLVLADVNRCGFCGLRCMDVDDLQQHLNSQHGKALLPNELFGMRFQNEKLRWMHMPCHRGKRWIPCEVCGKQFSRISQVRIHMTVHTRMRPYPCEICGKCFSQKSTRTRHYKKSHAKLELEQK